VADLSSLSPPVPANSKTKELQKKTCPSRTRELQTAKDGELPNPSARDKTKDRRKL
jgi:hypothetical protein